MEHLYDCILHDVENIAKSRRVAQISRLRDNKVLLYCIVLYTTIALSNPIALKESQITELIRMMMLSFLFPNKCHDNSITVYSE